MNAWDDDEISIVACNPQIKSRNSIKAASSEKSFVIIMGDEDLNHGDTFHYILSPLKKMHTLPSPCGL